MKDLVISIRVKTNKIILFLLKIFMVNPVKFRRAKMINFLLKRLVKYKIGDSSTWKYVTNLNLFYGNNY